MQNSEFCIVSFITLGIIAMHEAILIEDLAVVLCVAAFVTILFQKIKQPPILGYLIAGLIIGPYTPPFSFIDDEAEILILAQLGVIFLMFSLGLEFTLNKLAKVGFAATFTALFEVVGMMGIGYLAGQLLGWNNYESLLIGMALSISSTTIIIKSLENLQLKRMPFASLMVGVLIIEDLLAILMLVFVYTVGSMETLNTFPLFLEAVKLALMVLSWFFLGFFFIPSLMNKIHGFINQETLTIMSIGLCLFLSSLAAYLNYSAALGAFIMGTILAETKQGRKIEELTLPIRDIFLAVFFVSVGMLIDPITVFEHWKSVLFFTFLTIVGKVFTSTIGALLAKQSLETSLKVGLGMAQIGEFSFIVVGIGGTIFTASEDIYPIIIAVATITTFTTPYLIKYGIPFCDQIQDHLPEPVYAWLTKRSLSAEEARKRKKSLTTKQKGLIRFILNSLIVSIIFTGTLESILLFPSIHFPFAVKLSVWFVGLAISLPFLWAMLFYSVPPYDFKNSWIAGLGWGWVLLEIYLFSVLHIHNYALSLLLVCLAIALIFGLRKYLKILYIQVEKIFLDNLNLKLVPAHPKWRRK